jgi:hypothetical protein
MRTFKQNRFMVLASMVVAAGCSGPTNTAAPAANYRTDLTIQDVMDTLVDPSADFIWGSVATEVGPKGIVDKAPKNDAEWLEVRRHAVVLMESANLLKMPGRKVARAGTKSENPGIEEEPEGTKALMDADQTSWNKATDALYDAAALLLKAADAKSADAILDSGNTLDQACEACHLKYWYPKQNEILKELNQKKK